VGAAFQPRLYDYGVSVTYFRGLIFTNPAKDKQLKRILSKPPKKDITYRELESLLVGMGYQKVEGSGSRVSYYNSELDNLIELHKPHHGKELKVYQVKLIQERLKEIFKE
jgi:hypothetical protein